MQIKKCGIWVSFMGVLTKGYTRGIPWEPGETVYTRAVGNLYQELIPSGESVGCYLGHDLA